MNHIDNTVDDLRHANEVTSAQMVWTSKTERATAVRMVRHTPFKKVVMVLRGRMSSCFAGP